MTPAQKNSSPLAYVKVAEQGRLNIACEQGVPCKKWGPYLSDPQWGAVREDYGTTIRRATERLSILVWLALLLALQVSAQSVQPTLEDTMTFITSTLNSRGIVSWTTTDQDLAGAKWTTTSSLAQVNADPSTCSLAWTNIKIQSPDKTVETYLVQLQTVSDVNVQSHSRSSASQSGDKLQFSPDTYLILIRTTTAISGHLQSYKKDKLKSTANLPNDHAAEIQFPDEQTAARVADAIRRAAGLCGATQSSL